MLKNVVSTVLTHKSLSKCIDAAFVMFRAQSQMRERVKFEIKVD
jgi:hypothetical protein